MNTQSTRPRLLAVLLFPALVLGCRCSPEGEHGADGAPPVENDRAALPRDYSRKSYDFWPLPAGAEVGEWVERRITDETEGRSWTERIAVVGKTADALWVEESEDRTARGRLLVRLLLVSPDGRILEGRIGYEGEKGEPIALEVEPAPFAEEPTEVLPGPTMVDVPAGRFECAVEVYQYDSDVTKIYTSPNVPYDGRVKIEEKGRRTELIASGTDAKPLLAPLE